MKTNIFYNKTTAICTSLILIVFAVIICGARGLSAERSKALNVFEKGALNDGVSVSNDIANRVNLAYGILSTAGGYLSITESPLKELSYAANTLAAADTLEKKLDANTSLSIAEYDVYVTLQNAEMSEKDTKNIDSAHREMLSRNTTISRDEYNTLAADYNNLLTRFPANLIKSTGLAKPLPSFSGGN